MEVGKLIWNGPWSIYYFKLHQNNTIVGLYKETLIISRITFLLSVEEFLTRYKDMTNFEIYTALDL